MLAYALLNSDGGKEISKGLQINFPSKIQIQDALEKIKEMPDKIAAIKKRRVFFYMSLIMNFFKEYADELELVNESLKKVRPLLRYQGRGL